MKNRHAAKVFILMGVFFLMQPFDFVAAKSKKESAPPSTSELMKSFLEQLTALKPYMISPDKFSDPKNEIEISRRLKEFARLAKKTAHDPELSKENFKFSRDILEHHIADTERTFRLGNKLFARWQLASTAAICMSCHTQLRSTDHVFENFVNPSVFQSEFDQAEFLFATRSFDKAFAIYDKLILGFPKNGAGREEVGRALERQLAYYARLQRDLPGGLEKLKAYQKNASLPPYIQRNLEAWIQQLTELIKQKPINPTQANAEEILAYAKKNIESKWTNKMMEASNPMLVTYLYVSGLLYEYLNKHPRSSYVPEMLYWLSICDRSINYSFFYSLGDLYLRECITSYPGHPIAKKCYKEFEESTVLGYSGSSGTHVPPDVQADLDQLKKMVEGKGKINIKSPK